MKLPKDLLTEMATKPRLFLCEVDKQKICQLETTNLQGSFKFNAYSELSFTVGRTYTNIVTGKTSLNPFYDKIEGLRLVYLEGFGYFELQDPEDTSDGIKEVKNMTAYSLEYTLSQKYLEELNVNTGENNSIEVVYSNGSIIPVTLYNPSRPELSLLHIALEKVPGWKIGHIDASLQTMSRTFEISRVSVYDFIVQDICDKFNCFAVFDTVDNTINLYAEASVYKIDRMPSTTNIIQLPTMYRFDTIGSVAINGYKTIEYQYEQPTGKLTFNKPIEKGSFIEITDGSQEQWKTDIYVTFDNLAEEVNVSYDTDNIKTVLTIKGADDLDIREVNMGMPYLIDISYYHNVDWMGPELYDAYSQYLKKCNDGQADYKEHSQEMWELENYITYEEQRLSLEYSIADNVTSTTVGTYYVRGGTAPNYYYTSVKLPDEYNINVEHYYTLSGSDLDETKFSNLYEAFKTYFISQDEKDTSEIEKLKDSFAFMENNTIDGLSTILKNAASLEQKNTVILAFLDEMWDQLGLTPLKSLYYTSYQKIKEVNEEAGWNDPSNENYWAYYPVTLVINSLDKEISDRENTITELQEKYNILQKANNDIADGLVMANNFTLEQLIKLSAFLREDEYTDDNFVQTETDTIESIMRTKQELLECGRIELSKLCEPKLQFSMNMANIYALPEFEPIINQFQLGNIIRIKLRDARVETVSLVGDGETTSFNVPISLDEVKDIDFSNGKKITYEYNSKTGILTFDEAPDNDVRIEVVLVKYYIKQSRLLQVDFNFEDFSDFSCEFGELTSLRTPSSIHADLLASAMSAGKSVASNSSYWNKGADTVSSLALQIQAGLLDATTVIKSIDGTQGVEISDTGIHLRKYDPTTGALDPKEGWIVNNQFLYSDDNFKTTRSVFGEYTIDGQTKWGLLAEAVMAGYIAGCTIEGGTIKIGQHSSEKAAFEVDQNGNVSLLGGAVKFTSDTNSLADMSNRLDGRIDETNATLERTNQSITAEVTRAKNAENQLSSSIQMNADSITAEVTRAKNAESSLSSQIKINADSITSKVDNDSFGTLIEQNYDHVKIAWNKNSNYVQFENGAMNIYKSTSHSSDTLLMKQNYQGALYYHNGHLVGNIGTNNWTNDTSYRGLVFDLGNDAQYMCWAHMDNPNDTSYTVKLIYHANNDKKPAGLHFACNTYTNGYLYLTDSQRIQAFSDGSVGYAGAFFFINDSKYPCVKIDGSNGQFGIYGGTTFKIYNDVDADFYSNIKMNNYKLIDTAITTSSDARLKTNIDDTKVDALDFISNIEMKEFDWIETGEHEDIGMIAQQLQTIAPDLVYEDKATGKLSIETTKFIPYLIKAIQELYGAMMGDVATYSTVTKDKWIDTNSLAEKEVFIEGLKSYQPTELDMPKVEVEQLPVTLPIENLTGND